MCDISIGVSSDAPPVFPVGVLACTIRPGSPQDPPNQPPNRPHTADKPPQKPPQTATSGGHCTTPRAATPRAAMDCRLFTLADKISHNTYLVRFSCYTSLLSKSRLQLGQIVSPPPLMRESISCQYYIISCYACLIHN